MSYTAPQNDLTQEDIDTIKELIDVAKHRNLLSIAVETEHYHIGIKDLEQLSVSSIGGLKDYYDITPDGELAYTKTTTARYL